MSHSGEIIRGRTSVGDETVARRKEMEEEVSRSSGRLLLTNFCVVRPRRAERSGARDLCRGEIRGRVCLQKRPPVLEPSQHRKREKEKKKEKTETGPAGTVRSSVRATRSRRKHGRIRGGAAVGPRSSVTASRVE